MKTIKSEYNDRKYKVEIVESINALPCDAKQCDTILDDKTLIMYAIYKDGNNFYYAINDDN